MNINQLEKYFNSIDLPNKLILNECEDIKDVPKFVKTHISYLKGNSGNKRYKAYYDRLIKVYKYLSK